MSETAFKRVLIKISGEQFSGKNESGIDPNFVGWLAEEIKKVTAMGVQVAVVVGAGNWVRGKDYAGHGIERATADYMGMLSGVMNGQAMMDILQSHGQEARIMSSLEIEQVAEPFIRRKAIRHMEKGRVMILTAGLGKPFYTHDTAGVTFALELGCDIMFKATKVDGVYDKNPSENDDAKKFETIDYQSAIENPEIKVMDKAALGLAMEQGMPVTVFKLNEDDNFAKVVRGEEIGTKIS